MAVAAGACVLGMYYKPAPRARRLLQRHDSDSRRVDEASEDSFPASDPPSFSAPAGGAQSQELPPATRV
jgi:hypothetical protein